MIDIAGVKFGRWQVLSPSPSRGYDKYWLCRCECGKERPVNYQSLRKGTSRSCGCLISDTARAVKTTHGRNPRGHRDPTYAVWASIRQRCLNPRVPCYNRYGGRGITVCDRWNAFEAFLADVGERPSLEHSIDRIDNSKGYEPGNCRWATASEQARNRRSSRILEFRGQSKTLMEWSIIVGIQQATIGYRLSRGWSVERSLTVPAGPNGRKKPSP